MKIYLDGVEYKAYREILADLGVRFGCLNYGYIYNRTPRFDLPSACEFLDELMVIPGNLPQFALMDYVEFLENNHAFISFAVDFVTNKGSACDETSAVEVLPLYGKGLSYTGRVAIASLTDPFIKTKLLALVRNGASIHGMNCEFHFFDSMNSGTWMRGKAGWISKFDKKNKMQISQERFTRTATARELLTEGYEIDLNKVKREDWKEVAKVNCIAWQKYQDWMEDR